MKFGNSAVEIGTISENESLSENSDAILATQKAVKTYADTKADKAETEAALAAKADNTETEAALSAKADLDAMTAALETMADKTEIETALAAKADQATMETALDTKADKTETEAALAAKADITVLETSLATKAGFKPLSDISVPAAESGIAADLVLDADSRGIVMIVITTPVTAKAGLFAIHGTDITKIAGDDMANQQDMSSYNIYHDTDGVVIQNTTAEHITVKLTYLGV